MLDETLTADIAISTSEDDSIRGSTYCNFELRVILSCLRPRLPVVTASLNHNDSPMLVWPPQLVHTHDIHVCQPHLEQAHAPLER